MQVFSIKVKTIAINLNKLYRQLHHYHHFRNIHSYQYAMTIRIQTDIFIIF